MSYRNTALLCTSVFHLQRLSGGFLTSQHATAISTLSGDQFLHDIFPLWSFANCEQIPYSLTKAEVHAFLGRNAKVLTPDLGEPIHIIMERSTGKTMDCYVEFFSVGDAQAAINKLHRQRDEGNRYLRLQDRHVEVEISSQEALMKELFPRAKNVRWKGQAPLIVETNEPYNSGFKAFVTAEELVMLVKHAEQPQRVSPKFYIFLPKEFSLRELFCMGNIPNILHWNFFAGNFFTGIFLAGISFTGIIFSGIFFRVIIFMGLEVMD